MVGSPKTRTLTDFQRFDPAARSAVGSNEIMLRSAHPLVIVPARMASSRLPGKPLAEIAGKPMILHVLDRVRNGSLRRAAVATDSREIAGVVEAAGGVAILTRREHACGSDRVAEAAAILDPERRHGVVVNVQGDQPFLDKGAIDAAAALLAEAQADIGTVATVAAPDEADNPNAVKLIGSFIAPRRMRALYFTRARAPFGEGPLFKHIGVYAFRREALERFAASPPSTLERRERLEQLRALELSMRIDAAVLDKPGASVDTQRDLDAARREA
jgi:3-deoxy-manno-octulosonate cytidylyltransferase (CMP-KDO synthetase)